MEIKKYIQVGTFSVIVIIPFFILTLYMIFSAGFKDLVQVSILGIVAIILFICLLIFYKLTISIDNTYFSFKLVIGLIGKKYLISDIQSCKSVRNNPLFGIGIRKIPKGWLYNVSGLNAVELIFKNKKSKVRIGTNKPDEIVRTIDKMKKRRVI
jgi:hypothetical protein